MKIKRNFKFTITGTVDGYSEQEALDKLHDVVSCKTIEAMGIEDFKMNVEYLGFYGVMEK